MMVFLFINYFLFDMMFIEFISYLCGVKPNKLGL